MPEVIEHYNPQFAIQGIRKKALKAWALGLSLVFFWVFLILLAPVAHSFGWTGISNPVYKFFSFLCHQMPERSLYILEDHFAVCSRCFGVYSGLVFGFVIYPFIRNIEEMEPFPRFWLFLSLVPIGVDWSLGMFGIWENTHLTRFLTGLILGTACAVFIIPALVELAQLLSNRRKIKRLSS
jgi:uncharacterized membrane protein